MTAWHENARFDVFCKCDVYCEDGHYLYVENSPYDYSGNYVCHDYQQGTNADNSFFYMAGEYSSASNDYIMSLEKAPWNVARDVIIAELKKWKFEEERRENFEDAESIAYAMVCLTEEANEAERFCFG